MQPSKPVRPTEAPETDATYERTRAQTTVKPSDVTGDGSVQSSDDVRRQPLPAGGQIAGDMRSEEPQGWDQAPTDIHDPEKKRHPRPDGVGGSDPNSSKTAKRDEVRKQQDEEVNR